MMRHMAKQLSQSAAAVLFILTIAGCSDLPSSLTGQAAGPSAAPSITETTGLREQISPQQSYNMLQKEGIADDTKVITPPDQSAKAQGTGENVKTGSKPDEQPEQEAKWDRTLPKLNGMAIGDRLETINERFGQPLDAYQLVDENETIHVSEYNGFSVGFDAQDKLKFIEIYDSSVMTGLNGLRIGQKGEAAIQSIGKPTSQTANVLSYGASGALLKLDLDPRNGEILSIKLFVRA
ncbi:hypothetical protein [Paenibacillus abyssi]|uniref:DUF4309 domain-containing protein n=1 Tax=Paenibacillus abyssi TaxID=1340531 RepID=A0A917G447_9BACL|nr:hypothetical protein [Paenibacillus abyssi]GGG21963.1 hypothetical protein GCM10010916_43280 [Paenibacillus abyssi]